MICAHARKRYYIYLILKYRLGVYISPLERDIYPVCYIQRVTRVLSNTQGYVGSIRETQSIGVSIRESNGLHKRDKARL